MEHTFQESACLLGRAILSINYKDEDPVFSITDILCLLRSVNAHVPGEFEIRQTLSGYIQIVYTPDVLDEVGFDEGYILIDFVETFDRGQNLLWINEKVIIAFIERIYHATTFSVHSIAISANAGDL